MSRAQISALVFGVGGFGALVAATASNEWKVTTRASSVITATWVYQGLWMNCAGYIQACRGLMIAAVSLGFFGSIFALFGMKCTKVGGSDKAKAKIACLAGIVFILSGLCSMTGCSLYANKITTEFFDPHYVEQKMGYTYNGATSVMSSRTKYHGGEGDFKTTNPSKQFDKNAYV
ncbi:claudin-10 isoform X6 [Ictidomys tridecemlineatus]|uniref:claudin-10 isoform X6 n=1 Tax=Marmota marmota marmota TaxID=9994 RepID=UPI00038BEACF|nr:claudin-10 isoform X6 [Marmota marmota marmota]XP_026255812.1 claudin-10 isoform X4 [Urocitellus parryii]XP_027794737.1 claudin-10 isoform X6 [Marmota flaviventris]KAG3293280.1 claudin 10, transcript variant X4 [Ictidomys tridecemlineatus]